MRRGFYARLAMTGISKNRKTYIPYILTCIGMVMMFYLISYLSSSSEVESMPGGNSIQAILQLGVSVIGLFSVIFLFYTNSFLMRRRKKEFGLYNILGMGKWNLARVLVWESVIIAAISIGGGLFCGILFSKAAELCMIYVLEGNAALSFSISGISVGRTLCCFGIIFLLILLNALRQIHVSKPIELLRSESIGEKPPKANWLFAVVGIVFLVIAYYMAATIEEPMSAIMMFFVAVILVILATYLLFVSGSVAFCKLLQKNKRYYYKTNHFISVSSMVYRMKRNGAGLASICILSTMILVMISSTVCLYAGKDDSLRTQFPRNIVVDTYSYEKQYTDKVHETVETVLKEKGQTAENLLHYQYLDAVGYLIDNSILLEEGNAYTFQTDSYDDVRQLFIVPLEYYNQLMGKNETLNEDEVLIYSTKTIFDQDTLNLGDMGTLTVKAVVEDFVDNGVDAIQIIPSLFIFVPDMDRIESSLALISEDADNIRHYAHDYYGFDLSSDDETQMAVEEAIADRLSKLQLENEHFPTIYSNGAAGEKAEFYGLFGGLFFLGVMLGIVFICGAVLIMYYKQIIEGYEDQERFKILKKVGMTKKEIKKSVNSQILTVFFLPLLMAGIHVGFAFPIISRLLMLFGLTNTKFLIAVTGGCFLIFAVCYVLFYIVTSRAYYRIVSGLKEE